jgi:hypothetical protein
VSDWPARISPGCKGSYQAERDARWALNAARGSWRSTGRRRELADREGLVLRIYGYAVIRASRTRPWGTGVTAHARYSHAVRKVLIAFPQRRHLPGPVSGVTYWCGGTSETFTLTNEPTRTVCELCMFNMRRADRD